MAKRRGCGVAEAAPEMIYTEWRERQHTELGELLEKIGTHAALYGNKNSGTLIKGNG